MQPSPAQKIPLNIRRMGATYQLGTPQAMYTSKNDSSLPRFLGPFGMLIGSLIIVAFFLTYAIIFSWWPLWQSALILLLGVAWLGVGVWITLTSLLSRGLRVVVCPQGLISSTKGRTNIIRWDQIEVVLKDIKADSKAGFSRSYTICLRESTTWTFTSELSNVEELGAIVEDKVTRHFLPRTLAAYHAGRPVHFADIILIEQGISVQEGRRLLLWSDIDRLHIDDASVSIYKTGEFWDWSTTPTSKVPNVGVLKRLVDQIMRERANSQLPRVIATYKAGLPVVFGRLSVSLRGIDINYGREMLLPWSEIASIGVGESEVIIERKETLWEALPLSMISDASTLKELLDYRFSAGKPRSFMPGMKRRS